jgi:hypothetical protein
LPLHGGSGSLSTELRGVIILGFRGASCVNGAGSSLIGLIALPAIAETAFPDLRGTWKGDSESIVSGNANTHHTGTPDTPARLSSVTFTLKIDMQDGRRFSGTFSSSRSTESIVGVISRTGSIYLADSDGYTFGTLLAPNRLELCSL